MTYSHDMTHSHKRIAFVRRAAVFCGVLMLIITSLSAFIRLSNAGLGCTDRPGCYGEALRKVQRGEPLSAAPGDEAVASARSVHRIVAMLLLFVVVAMVVACFATRPTLLAPGASVLAVLGLTLFLAVLGVFTTGARVPAVAMGNLLGGFGILALCSRLSLAGSSQELPRLGTVAWIGAAVLLGQILVGALVSASYAGMSCPDLLGCEIPVTPGGWEMLNPWREPRFDASMPLNPGGALAHMTHRAGALVTLLVLLPLGAAAIIRGRRLAGTLLLALLAIQVALGILMVANALPLPLVLAHNATAALMLVGVVRLA